MGADVPSPKADTTVPASARIWNYWLGGKDYYPVDKAAGDQFAQFFPGIFDMARASRYFIARAVRYLAGEAGVRQFLDIGTGLPSHDSTGEIVQGVAPGARIVYVDNDQFVLARAQARAVNAGGGAGYIEADLNQPEALLRIARDRLDFSRPVAIMLMGVLGHIGNAEEEDDRVAQSIVGTLKAALPSDGYLAIYDTSDVNPGQNDALLRYNESGADPYRVRRPDQIVRFFDGLELVEPGVVPVQQWRPDDTPIDAPKDLINLGGVGRKALFNSEPGRRHSDCQAASASIGLSRSSTMLRTTARSSASARFAAPSRTLTATSRFCVPSCRDRSIRRSSVACASSAAAREAFSSATRSARSVPRGGGSRRRPPGSPVLPGWALDSARTEREFVR